ncbi:MAG: ATP-grasp domain-containing protein [Bacteroidales bacterium]|nr:ATP-grasp domain-containing protein [Bacteroidales bacterium]
MIILEKPYVSAPLVAYLEEKQIPVLHNDMAELLKQQGHQLNLLEDQQFVEKYQQTQKLYAVSENALMWLYAQLPDSELVKKVKILKDKAAFRRICQKIYPDFYYKEVELKALRSLDPDALPLPLVLKPSVGFLSVGVYIVRSKEEWQTALDDIDKNFAKQCAVFPDTVVKSEMFVLEQFIEGEEYAVDAYYDADGQPNIINIFHHIFKDETDVSDRLYCMSKQIFETNYPAFNQFCIDLNGVLQLTNFPMHVEFRVDKRTGRAIPIEVNPLRFAGMCLNDLTRHTCGLLPVQAFFEGTRPDYATMWNGIEEDVFSFVVLDKPFETTRSIDFEAIKKHFHGVLETRDIKNPAMSIWGFLFTKTTPEHKDELKEILFSDLQEFMI